MFVRKEASWRIAVTTAPASAEERYDASDTGFCWAPKVPGWIPCGSTLLVRHRIATGWSAVNRTAPPEPTGKFRIEPRTSTTSTIRPAGRFRVADCGVGFAAPPAWNRTVTVTSLDVGL